MSEKDIFSTFFAFFFKKILPVLKKNLNLPPVINQKHKFLLTIKIKEL